MSNVAVVGCGAWGENLIRVFKELGVLVSVFDIVESRLDYISDKYKVEVNFPYEEKLEDEKIDAIAIATTASTHFELAKLALNANKDVFVEKPMAMTSNECQELIELAEKNERILMVGHLLEYHPALIKLKQLVKDGELGQTQYIYSNRLNLGKVRTEENVLWSFAPHDISTILSLLGSMPEEVNTYCSNYLNKEVADVSLTHLRFPGGVDAHIFVSWLHPFKEQRLVVVGSKSMAVFDDLAEDKLMLYPHDVKWEGGTIPVVNKAEGQIIPCDNKEPLMLECQHLLDCIRLKATPKTDGYNGLRVLKVLEMCQGKSGDNDYFLHKSSFIDDNVKVGRDTKIWHFSHILKDCEIGERCNIGQNVVIGPNVKIGNGVKIQNNVSVYEGVTLEDDVFCGPSCVFTNVINPRSEVSRKKDYRKTLVRKGATIGANATIICGVTIGRYAFVGAGAVVTKDVSDHAVVYGVPAVHKGTMDMVGKIL